MLAMRLTRDQVTAIKSAVAETLGAQAETYLFGSRVDDARKGGDIDLLIIPTVQLNPDESLDAKLKIRSRLFRSLGERKIDIVFQARSAQPSVFQQIVHETGKAL